MSSKVIMYGIPNCDVIKKSSDWMRVHDVEFVFHNYRSDGIDIEMLKDWSSQVGVEKLLNRRSTTWKELSPETQASATSDDATLRILMEHPTAIKRPVLIKEGKVLAVGFDANLFTEKLIK